MRIALVATSMTTGGVQSVVKDLANELSVQGHEVAVISLCREDAVDTLPAVRRWSLGHPGVTLSTVVPMIASLRKILHEFAPDVVHSHAFHANLIAAVALRGRARTKLVATVHNVTEGGRVHALLAKVLRSAVPRTIAVSGAVATSAGLPGEAVIYNAIDVDQFRFDANARSTLRDALGVGADEILAISVGRLSPAKGFDTLVAAMRDIRRHRADAPRVFIVGEGPEREELESAIAAGELAHEITLLGRRTDVGRLLSAADVYVQSSIWEGFPIVLLEASASGLPIIATRAGGTEELDPRPDILLEVGDTAALSTALSGAVSLVRPHAQRSVATANMGKYSAPEWAAQWLQLYARPKP